MKLNRRLDIQYARALAVLFVVVHHTKPDFFPNGYLGVDVFFVISGYLIIPKISNALSTHDSKIRGLIKFYLNRYLRLGPAFSVFLIFNLVLIFGLGSIFDFRSHVFQSLYGLIGVGNFGSYTLTPDYFHSRPMGTNHLWSLGVETQFYFFIPICAFLLVRIRLKSWLFIFFIISLSLFLSTFKVTQSGNFFDSYYSPTLRVWEFIAGGLIALNPVRFKKLPNICLYLFMIALALLPLIRVSERIGIVSIVVITCILMNSDQISLTDNVISKILAWIGDRSYSIYLYHLPLIFIARHSPYLGDDFSHLLSLSIALLLTFVLGDLSFKMIEQKFDLEYSDSSALTKPIILNTCALILSVLFLTIGSLSNWLLLHKNQISLPIASNTSLQCSSKDCLKVYSDSILLLGDSHANVIYDNLSTNLFENRHMYTLNLSKNGCGIILPSVLRRYQHSSNSVFRSCAKHNQKVFTLAREEGNILIIAQRSSIYHPEGLVISNSDYRKAYFESIEKFLDLENKVLIVGTVPDWPYTFSNIYQEVGVFQRVVEPLHEISKSEVNRSYRDHERLKEMTLEAGKEYESSFDVFCDDFVCSRFAEGKWLYTDESHLSSHGVMRLVKSIKVWDLFTR